MTYRTALFVGVDTSFVLDYFGVHNEEWQREIKALLAKFPHVVVIQLSYPELDFADHWCWQQFGPASGACYQQHSEYPACFVDQAHSHEGCWHTKWIDKTDYDFGYNAWCFSNAAHRDQFLAFFPEINWGEKFPK